MRPADPCLALRSRSDTLWRHSPCVDPTPLCPRMAGPCQTRRAWVSPLAREPLSAAAPIFTMPPEHFRFGSQWLGQPPGGLHLTATLTPPPATWSSAIAGWSSDRSHRASGALITPARPSPSFVTSSNWGRPSVRRELQQAPPSPRLPPPLPLSSGGPNLGPRSILLQF